MLTALAVAILGIPLHAQKFGDWSVPVNVGTKVNTAAGDWQPTIGKNALSLYFPRWDSVNVNTADLMVAYRDSVDEPWDGSNVEIVKLPTTINVAGRNEANPSVSVDGHRLYFNSNRTDADPNGVVNFGLQDIFVARRQNKRVDDGPGGWEQPVNLGAGVNTVNQEQMGTIFEDETTGTTTLYFNRLVAGNNDIYASTLQPDGTFGHALPVTELNTPFTEQQVTISRDGLEIYFISDRPGSIPYPQNGCCGPAGQPSLDIWVSTRASTAEPWGEPQPVTALNSPFHDGRPSLSFDGKSIYFFSAWRLAESGYLDCVLYGQCNVSRYFDVWMSTREKVNDGQDK